MPSIKLVTYLPFIGLFNSLGSTEPITLYYYYYSIEAKRDLIGTNIV